MPERYSIAWRFSVKYPQGTEQPMPDEDAAVTAIKEHYPAAVFDEDYQAAGKHRDKQLVWPNQAAYRDYRQRARENDPDYAIAELIMRWGD